MGELISAIAVFIASHIILIRASLRLRLEKYIGEKMFRTFYSLLSVLILVWLAIAFKQAPYIQLWPTMVFATWIPVILMPIACLLLITGIFTANPLSLSIRRKAFDPMQPGIVSITRHPVMWAFALWAISHIPANGDLSGVLLFGLMLALSLYGCKTIDRNKSIRLGKATWEELSRNTSIVPFAALLRGNNRLNWRDFSLLQFAGGILLYVLFTLFHQNVIGIAPPVMVLLS